MNIIRDRAGKLPIKILIIIMVLAIGGGGFAFVKMSGKGHKKVVEKVPPTEVPLAEFTVNLADQGGSRYMKISMVLDVEGKIEAPKGEAESKEVKLPEEAKVRDAINTVLMQKTYDELITDKGKTKLKTDLMKALNEVLEKNKVSGIYFTSLVME